MKEHKWFILACSTVLLCLLVFVWMFRFDHIKGYLLLDRWMGDVVTTNARKPLKQPMIQIPTPLYATLIKHLRSKPMDQECRKLLERLLGAKDETYSR